MSIRPCIRLSAIAGLSALAASPVHALTFNVGEIEGQFDSTLSIGANWSTQSTLVVGLAREDGIDAGIVNEACAILVEYEELRYTRLQLEPPAGTTGQVRWRQCQ